MQVFFVDPDPRKAARALCDQHVPKMVLETAQILCDAARLLPLGPRVAPTIPYRRARGNPWPAEWAAASRAHFNWLVEHGKELAHEHMLHWGPKHWHRSRHVIEWAGQVVPFIPFPEQPFLHPPYLSADDLAALGWPGYEKKGSAGYLTWRQHYKRTKAHFATWAKGTRKPPEWW